MIMVNYKIILLIFTCGFMGCADAVERLQARQTAMGATNQLVIICDEEDWNGPLGDSLYAYYDGVYPVLPQPEPLFDLKHFSPREIKAEKLRRGLRSYLILATLDDTSSASYQLIKDVLGAELLQLDAQKDKRLTQRKNVWADGQVLFFQVAENDSVLQSAVAQYFPQIATRVNEHDKTQIDAKTYLSGVSKYIINKIDTVFGAYLKVPGDYKIAEEEKGFLWLRKDVEDITMNILLQEIPYGDTTQFGLYYIKNLRDQLGRTYVESTSDNSFMVTNDVDLPMYTYRRTVNGRFAVEARGIWEMENDFMGGPFISYLLLNDERNTLLYFDGFVLAPGHKKRGLIQELEHIAQSFEPNKE